MPSIYQRALGSDFEKLHPRIQQRFGFHSESGIASIGAGTMDTIWRGPFYAVPFLHLGARRRIMFPDYGQNVPFTIENYAYRDRHGRETVTWLRTFETETACRSTACKNDGVRAAQTTRSRGRTVAENQAPHERDKRRFDAYMIYSEKRGCIVDYLGSHQHLAVDLELSVDEQGGLRFRSGAQRFYEGSLAFSFPLFFSGVADVREWYDEDADRFGISVEVTNRRWGRLFGYRGSFDVTWKQVVKGEIPTAVRPLREERRE